MESSERFDQWAIVEVMGHERLAGRVTEQAIGGCSFVRVDVPAVRCAPAFTKLLGPKAIHSISIVDQETAMVAAREMQKQPLEEWSAREMLNVREVTRACLGDDAEDGSTYITIED